MRTFHLVPGGRVFVWWGERGSLHISEIGPAGISRFGGVLSPAEVASLRGFLASEDAPQAEGKSRESDDGTD